MSDEPSDGGCREASGGVRQVHWPITAGVMLALAVLAATILVSLLHLRRHIFIQIANRDGETLGAIAAMQYADDKANDESVTTLEDPGEQIQLALKISTRLKNVLGVRLFSPEGQFVAAFPPYLTETLLSSEDLALLHQLRPISHFARLGSLKEQDLLAETNGAPVPFLGINVPLHEEGTNHLAGIAQFLMDGSSIAREYSQLDQHLAAQGVVAFVISGGIIATGLTLAFGRVRRANALLAERTRNLLKANRELALAAKTSAVGAVTSHLIHGLKNPLSGLRSFVQDRAQGQESAQDSDWQLAVATTQRMQTLIDRVVRVLQEQQTDVDYEISFPELSDLLSTKFQSVAKTAGVKFNSNVTVNGSVSNREADLILLILENLVQNAIEATPSGKSVDLRIAQDADNVLIEVEDEGGGLKPELAGSLFAPCASSKKGGSGIGLAISRQLATHLGATLELKKTSSSGCCFGLALPKRNLTPKSVPRDQESLHGR